MGPFLLGGPLPESTMSDTPKTLQYKTDTQVLIDNMQRDYKLMNEKYEMVTVAELSLEKGKHYMKLLDSFLEKCIKNYPGSFFILVRRRHEVTDRLMDRLLFKQALALPTPQPGWGCWKYDADLSKLEFLYDLPPEKACRWALKHKYTVGIQKPVVMQTILDYYDGTLHKKVNELNNQISLKGEL